jgi:hypothetical protein
VVFALLALPVAPINSPLWKTASDINGELKEMVGWPEMVESVATIYAALPADEKPVTAILAGNYGEAGAIDLYGPAYGLPGAISGTNSYWLRGYGDPPPQQAIVLGFDWVYAQSLFNSCELAGRNTNRFGVMNEEARAHGSILLCRGVRGSWAEIWPRLLNFG